MKNKLSLLLIVIMIISMFVLGKHTNYYKFDNNLYLAVLVDGENRNDFPEKGDYEVIITCDNADVKWDYENWQLILNQINRKTECAVAFKTSEKINLTEYIISLSDNSTTTGVYNEYGYRYQGKKPNNWVLFNGEYWRIIGVFDDETHGIQGQNLVKIIRNDLLGALSWSKNGINNWEESSLKALLNNNYYNGTEESTPTNCYLDGSIPANCQYSIKGITKDYYRDMIEEVIWKLGAHTTPSETAEFFYNVERGTVVYENRPTQVNAHIGLMYPSDYGFSVLASSCNRTMKLSSYGNLNCAGESWLYGKGYVWMITPTSNLSYDAFNTYNTGYVSANYNSVHQSFGVRPVIYLKSGIKKLAGDGSLKNPYIIVK